MKLKYQLGDIVTVKYCAKLMPACIIGITVLLNEHEPKYHVRIKLPCEKFLIRRLKESALILRKPILY